MTNRLNYRIRLVKDAEPGTGFGGQTVNDLVPRDEEGWPVIPASHVKGLARAALKEIAEPRTNWREALDGDDRWPRQLLDRVFGGYDQQESDEESVLRFTNAGIEREDFFGDRADESDEWVETRYVSRTAIGEAGIAEEHSLRTTESIPKGTEFHGTILCEADTNSIEGLAAKLSLLSVGAVGGSRNRGGQCIVDFLTEGKVANGERPGQMLRELDAAISQRRFASLQVLTTKSLGSIQQLAPNPTLVELVFIGDSPICCPERADKSNVISSGFSIPASAVQGVILHYINRRNPDLATSLFDSESFRCWPLNPCGSPQDRNVQRARTFPAGDPSQLFDELPLSVRVSLSHRVAKYSLSETYTAGHFFDRAFADRNGEFRWPDSPDGAPLRGSDGVLLHGGQYFDQPVLWKAAHMPRTITTHGVLDGPREHAGTLSNGRNLFTVDAMAPLIWRGAVSIPDNVADALIESLNTNPEVSIGKARTVRGSGRLVVRRLPSDSPFWGHEPGAKPMALVMQSPTPLPDRLAADLVRGNSAEQILAELAVSWLNHHGLPRLAAEPALWANVGIRFGWNRHRRDGKGSGAGLQSAVTVFLPGTVIALEGNGDAEQLRKAVVLGFRDVSGATDAGRNRGFGALAIHPGVANDLYRVSTRPRRHRSTNLAGAMQIVLDCKTLPHLPSPSQIRSVEQRIDTSDTAKAKEYLDEQCGRIIKVWYDWELAYDYVVRLLKDFEPATAKKALRSLAEVSIAMREDNR